jgi:hypothetical protein
MTIDDGPDLPSSDEIDRVIALLGSLPDLPMPQDITTRLTHVISAESALRTAATPVPVAQHADQPIDQSAEQPPHPGTSRRPGRGRWLFAAAGIAAVGVVGVALVVNSRTVPTPPVAAPQPSRSEQNVISDNSGFSVQPISSGLSYTAESLAPAVSAHMTSTPAATAATERRASSFAATPAGVKSCLEGVGASIVDLRMIDLANYENLPSAIMAFSAGDQDRTADVVVVGTLCNRENPQVRTRAIVVMAR